MYVYRILYRLLLYKDTYYCNYTYHSEIVYIALGTAVLNSLRGKGVRKCRAIIPGEFFHVEQEARVSVDFMKIYPGIERGLRREHPAIDFLTPSTRSLFPPVTIPFYFSRARKKEKRKRSERKRRNRRRGSFLVGGKWNRPTARLHACSPCSLLLPVAYISAGQCYH